MQISRNYLPLCIITFMIFSGCFAILLQWNMRSGRTIHQRLDQLQHHLERAGIVTQTNKESPTPLEQCEWTVVRRELRNAVVQVFSHIAEFNWLEPYRPPTQGQSRGSAFFISNDGELITNAHVVDQSKAVFIQIPSQGKRQFEADVIGVSMDRDLALLKLKPQDFEIVRQALGSIPVLSCADSDAIHGSEEIMTLGYPLGQQSLKGTTGIVSGRERINGQYMIQISAPINPGNSGGPAINRCGQVVGVNTLSMFSAQNVNYIIPSNEVTLFVKQLKLMISDRKEPTTDQELKALVVRKSPLGLIYAPSSDDLAHLLKNPLPGGLYITDVCSNSLVGRAGLKAGDMIYEFNGYKVDIFGEMHAPWTDEKIGIIDLMSLMTYGDTINMKIYRNGTPHTLTFIYETTPLPPIRKMFPGYEEIDYEIVGGMVIMPLSLNLLQIMAPAVPDLTWYFDVRHQLEPAIVITHLLPDSVATRSRVINIGAVITELNGRKVSTLEDVRDALKESISTNLITFKTREGLFVAFPFDQVIREEEKLARNFCYATTPTIRELRKIMYEKAQAALTNKVSALPTSLKT
jgi:S1-C subfamily serine protease